MRQSLKIIIFISLACLASCSSRLDKPLALPVSINISADEKWAVVTVPYTAFSQEAGETAAAVGYARRGEVMKVEGLSYVGSGNELRTIWYQFENGWLPENAVRIYSNSLRAQQAAQELE